MLVRLFHEGDVEALDLLLERYRRFARAKARGYFLAGGDSDDIEQEGMIGLFKAIRDFRHGQSSFRAFAELCITRQIITAIKTRHPPEAPAPEPLRLPVGPAGDRRPSERLVEELFDQHVPDPADEVVSLERLAAMRDALADLLSGLEVEVLRLYLDGRSYQEISGHLGRHVKSIDNALQRIKRKLEAPSGTAGHRRQSVPAA